MRASTGTTVFIGLASVVVVVAVVAGLIMLPAPGEERTRRLDERRVEDLRGVAGAMDMYWTRHGSLPASMAELASESGVRISTRDPGNEQEYELRVLDAATYELCASFERTSADSAEPDRRAQDPSEDFWSHGVGRQCFRLEAQDVPSRERRPLDAHEVPSRERLWLDGHAEAA